MKGRPAAQIPRSRLVGAQQTCVRPCHVAEIPFAGLRGASPSLEKPVHRDRNFSLKVISLYVMFML